MVNTKTRNQWKARLEFVDVPTPPARDEKGEAVVQHAQTEAQSVLGSKRKKLGSMKRKLGEAPDEQEIVTFQNDVQDYTQGKPISPPDGTMRSFNTRAPAHQRKSKRLVSGSMERRDFKDDALAESNISPDIFGKELAACNERKKGKREASGYKVPKHGKLKVGDVVRSPRRELNPNRKRRNLLVGIGEVSEDIVNADRTRTRGMVKPGTDGQAGIAHSKKRKLIRPEGKAAAPPVAGGESTTTAFPSVSGEEATVAPPIEGSDVEFSNIMGESDPVIKTKPSAPLESRDDVSGRNHVPLQVEAQPSRLGRQRKHGKSISEVQLVDEAEDRLPITFSPRVTRGMKETGSEPGVAKGSLLSKDPKPGNSIDDVVDLAAVPAIAVETATMQLRNHKKVGESLSSAGRPQKRFKINQDKLSPETGQKAVVMLNANDSIPKERTANGIEGLGGIDLAAFNGQLNLTDSGRSLNPSLDRNEDNNGGAAEASSLEVVRTRGSKMDGPSGVESQVDLDLIRPGSGLVQCIKGGVEKQNDKDAGHSKKCTEGDGRKGDRLGRTKKRDKKKIDPGGDDSVPDKKASDPYRNALPLDATNKNSTTGKSSRLGPGPFNDAQVELAEMGIDGLCLEGMILKAGGKSEKPLDLPEMRDETVVEKSPGRADNGGCQRIALHQSSPETRLDKISNVEENKLETLTPREGPSKYVGVVTRGSKVDVRKSIGPLNGSTEERFKSEGAGRLRNGKSKADSRVVFQNSRRHAENCKEDSSHQKHVDENKNVLLAEPIHQYADIEEFSEPGSGPISEVRMGLGEKTLDVQAVGANTRKGAGRLKEPSELQDVSFGEKSEFEKSVELTLTDGGDKQVDHPVQPGEVAEIGIKHNEKVIVKKLSARSMGVVTRARKAVFQCETEPDMERGDSDQPCKGGRKRTSDVREAIGSVDETKANFEISKEGRENVVDSGGLSASLNCQAEKSGPEVSRDENTGEGKIVEPARNMEKPTKLQGRGSEGEKGTCSLVKLLAEMERVVKLNDHHDEAPKQHIGDTFDPGEVVRDVEKNHRTRRARVAVADVSTNDSSLLKSSMGLIELDTENLSADAGKRIEVPEKRKRKEQATRTDGDPDRPAVAEHESSLSVRVSNQGVELAKESSIGGKGRRGGRKKVKKAISADLHTSPEKAELELPIEVENIAEKSLRGSCNIGNGEEELSKASLIPKRRKSDRSRSVTSTSTVMVCSSKVVAEVAHSVEVTKLASGPRVDSGIILSNGSGGQRSLLDVVEQVLPDASEVDSEIRDGKSPDQKEPIFCDSQGQEQLPRELSTQEESHSCRSEMVSSTVGGDGSTFKETLKDVKFKNLPSEHEVTPDNIQSEGVEKRAESSDVAVEVAQNPMQVVAELVLESVEAQGEPPDSNQIRLKKKKVRRINDYGRGIEFQRVTRARDAQGKSLSDTQIQGGKSGVAPEAVSSKQVDTRAEEGLSTTELAKDPLLSGATDAQEEGLELGKRLLDALELPSQPPCVSGKFDTEGVTIEQEIEQVMEAQKSLAPGTDVFAEQEAEKCDEVAPNSFSVLNCVEELKTGVQGEVIEQSKTAVQWALNGERDDQPAMANVSLPYTRNSNFSELYPNLPVSPDGPFALEDGKSLASHSGQEKRSNLSEGGVDLELTDSSNFEKMCAEDGNRCKAYSLSTLEKSGSFTLAKIPDPASSVNESDSVTTLVDSVLATIVDSSSVATTSVESASLAAVVELNPRAATVESFPAVSKVEAFAVATIVESGLAATTIGLDPVPFTVESHLEKHIVGPDPGATAVESDPLNVEENVNPINISDSNVVSKQNSIAALNMFVAVPAIGKLDCVAAVTTPVTKAVDALSLATADVAWEMCPVGEIVADSEKTIGDCLVPEVVNSRQEQFTLEEQMCLVGEIAAGSKNSIGDCLISEAVNSRQEQCTLEELLEDFGLTGDDFEKSPILECVEFQRTLRGEVSDSVELARAPVEESVRQLTLDVQEFLPEACVSSEPFTKEQESTTDPEPSMSLREGVFLDLLSSDCPQLDLTDQKCTVELSAAGDLEQFATDRTAQEGARVPSMGHSQIDQKAEIEVAPFDVGFHKSLAFAASDLPVANESVESSEEDLEQFAADRTAQEGARVPSIGHSQIDQKADSDFAPFDVGVHKSLSFAASDLPVRIEPEATSRLADSNEVLGKNESLTSPISRSTLDDVTVDNDPLEEKLPSGSENLHQTPSEGEDSVEPILKTVDVELERVIEVYDETKEENSEVREVDGEVDGIHTEVKQVLFETREMVTDAVELQSEAEEEVSLKAKESNLVVGTLHAEVQDVEVEAQLVDGAERLDHTSSGGDAESINADTADKQSDTEGKELNVAANEVHYKLEWRTEMNAQQETDAEAKDLLADGVRCESEDTKETVFVPDNMDTTSTRQPPPSNCLAAGGDSSVSAVAQTLSVPEVDISNPRFDRKLGQQTAPSKEVMNTESVTFDAEEHVQLDAPEISAHLNQQDLAQSGQLPLESSRCLEGDVLPSEELSDTRTETHEKDDSDTRTLTLEDPVSLRNMGEVKASLVYRKRKGRTGIDLPKEVEGGGRAEDAPIRVYTKRKGFLLASTSIESGGMRIRPRPLDPDQSIPILFEGRDKDFHDYDGGSFYRWIQQQEVAKLRNPTADAVADGISEGGAMSAVSRPKQVKKIFVPLFRKLPQDKQTNGTVVMRPEQESVPGMQSPFPRPHVYLRHTNPVARNLGHALGGSFCTVPSVYDMDDEDEEWLQAYNEILKHSGAGHLLSEDTFEQLMELFEREFFRICQINEKFLPVLPRNVGGKSGSSRRCGKRSVLDPSQRVSWLEVNKDGAGLLKSMESFQGPSSQKEIERGLVLQNRSEDCCICNGGENSNSNPVRRCQICLINVHESCYGIFGTEGNVLGNHAENQNWRCRKCEAVFAGRTLPSISCAICWKSGGALKSTVDPLKWAHVACALYTNETFFIDTEAMEPIDGLAAVETRVKKQRERCGLCGAREGSCVRCSTRGCRTSFHISCGVSQGASFVLRHTKQQVEGIQSFCPHHATIVPGTNTDEIHHASSKADDAGDTLPAVSTESSGTLGGRQIEPINTGDEGNGTEDTFVDGAGWQGSFSNKTKLHLSERKRYVKSIRCNFEPTALTGGGVTPSSLDPNSSAHEIFEKDMLGVSRTLPRSGSMLKETMQGVLQYMDETDPYVHPSDAERLDSEAVSASTSASSSHLTTFENFDRAGKATSNVDEVDAVVLAAKEKSVTWNAEISQALSLKYPSLDNYSTNLAPRPIVKAVYSFWQVKRVKSKGPILNELRQLQVARSQGIFNRVVNRSTDLLPPGINDSPARLPVSRRPRSLNRDPIFSRFPEVRQQLDILRSIASNVVRREQVKLEDQKLMYESLQQRLLIAREAPRTRRCVWCAATQSLLNCTSCPKAFCFQCFKHRRGYGVKGWIAASKLQRYVCNFCLGSNAQERGWPELSATFPEPRSNPIPQDSLVPNKGRDLNHSFEVRTNLGKQVSLNESSSNPYESSSLPVASTLAPGRGKTMYTGRVADLSVPHTKFAVPGPIDRSGAVDRAKHGGPSSGPSNQAFNESRVQSDHQHGDGKKAKRKRPKVVNREIEPKPGVRSTKRIKKLARSSSFVYGSEDETAVSEGILVDKRTVKLSELRDKEAQSPSTSSREVGAEGKAEKGHPPLKFGIKFSPTGTLIVRRHEHSKPNK